MSQSSIEEILIKHGVSQSKELSLALEEILKKYSQDRDLAKNVSKTIQNIEKVERYKRGIR